MNEAVLIPCRIWEMPYLINSDSYICRDCRKEFNIFTDDFQCGRPKTVKSQHDQQDTKATQ